jgi:hypothetical protein
MPVKGEYRLSANDLLIRGEISPEASPKIRAALPLAELPLQPFFEADDHPRAYFNTASSAASFMLYVIFLFFDPSEPDSEHDIKASK